MVILNEDLQEIRELGGHFRKANAKAVRQDCSQCVVGTLRNPVMLERSGQEGESSRR